MSDTTQPSAAAWSRLPPPEVLAFVASFALFAILAAPGITWMDSGELTAAAFHLGGAHPPGHPAHTLLGKLATLAPFGEIALRLALLSAACMAAAVAGVVALARALVPDEGPAAAGASLLVALAPITQLNATRAEVYAPACALLVWAMVMTVRYVRATDHDTHAASNAFMAALLCGLAAAFHPLIAASAALPMALAILVAGRAHLRALALPSLGLGLLGLLAYAQLPVRANASDVPPIMWGDPSTLSGFVDVLRAPAYQGNFSLAGAAGRFGEMIMVIGEGMGLAVLFAGILGLAFAAVTRLRGAVVPLAGAVCVLLGAATQKAWNPDMPGYVLPALMFLAAGIAPIVGAITRMLPGEAREAAWRPAIAAVVIVPLLAMGASATSSRAAGAGFRSGDGPLRLWSETVELLPPGPGLYFANSDHALFSAQYEQLVAGGRPDIALANAELSRDRWFLARLKALAPDIYVPFIDDGKRYRSMAARMAEQNLAAGRVVAGDEPVLGRIRGPRVRALGRSYLYAATAAPAPSPPARAPAPPVYEGDIGTRIARRIGLTRALYEAARGHLAEAARAAGIDAWFGAEGMAALARATPGRRRPPLYSLVGGPTTVFISAPWQLELLATDLGWVAGAMPRLPAQRHPPPELVLHAVWRALLSGKIEPGDPMLAGLDRAAARRTASMLVTVQRPRLAELQLTWILANQGEDAATLLLLGSVIGNRGTPAALTRAETLFRRATELAPALDDAFARLGLVLIKQGKRAEARAAWQRAISLNPRRSDIARMLQGLTRE